MFMFHLKKFIRKLLQSDVMVGPCVQHGPKDINLVYSDIWISGGFPVGVECSFAIQAHHTLDKILEPIEK